MKGEDNSNFKGGNRGPEGNVREDPGGSSGAPQTGDFSAAEGRLWLSIEEWKIGKVICKERKGRASAFPSIWTGVRQIVW